MTCPCPRPPGLSDADVHMFLRDWAINNADDPYPPGPSYEVDTLSSSPWHVVEWRRCPYERWREGEWRRCSWVEGHEYLHVEPGGWWEHRDCYGFRDTPQVSWPVPCWVTTAEEAERWRPEQPATRDCPGDDSEWWAGGYMGRPYTTIAERQAAQAIQDWARALAAWTPPRPAPLPPATLFDRALRWWRTRAERKAARHVDAVNRALVQGSLHLTTGGLPVED